MCRDSFSLELTEISKIFRTYAGAALEIKEDNLQTKHAFNLLYWFISHVSQNNLNTQFSLMKWK